MKKYFNDGVDSTYKCDSSTVFPKEADIWGHLNISRYLPTSTYSTTYHSRASECLQNIRGTDSVVFVLILNPQISYILLVKSVPWAQPQISNKIMCPYYRYVVLY